MQFEELKQRHAAMWGSAPFERVAETLAEMHARIVETVEGRPGERWLDVGCGTGELAFLAAATGATVTGADLSPARSISRGSGKVVDRGQHHRCGHGSGGRRRHARVHEHGFGDDRQQRPMAALG